MTLSVVVDGRRTAMPPGWSALAGDRKDEHWTWRLLDRQGRFQRELVEVESGSLDLSIHNEVQGGGSLTWAGPSDALPVWRDVRVAPVYHALLGDDTRLEWQMGEYLCSSPDRTHQGRTRVTAQVRLHDRVLLLLRAKLTREKAYPAGTAVVPAIRALLTSYGINRFIIEDSTATLRGTMAWEAGTSLLRVVNDLLDTLDYFSMRADQQGVLRSSKRVAPGSRPLEWTFTDETQDQTAFHEDIGHEEDDFEVPNRVTVSSRGDGYDFELVTTRTLDQIAPGHKWSYARTGEWVDRFEDGVDITNEAALNAYADRLLREGVSPTSNITVPHRPLPLELHDRVAVRASGVDAPSGTIQAMSIECQTGGSWTSTIREVVG